MNTGATLSSPHATLRAIEPEDVDFILSLENDESMWAFGDQRAPYSKATLNTYALTYDPDPLRSGQLRLIIEDAEGEAAGALDLFGIDPYSRHCWIGIGIVEAKRRKGLATAALRLAVKYATEILGIIAAGACVAADNDKGRHLFEKAGFTLCGKLPEWYYYKGERKDILLYVALAGISSSRGRQA